MPQTDTAPVFLRFSRHKLMEQYWPRMQACVESLSAEQVWWRPNASSNSIGNLLLHLNGNVTQWLVVSFDREEDQRNRPAEFATTEGLSANELLQRLGDTLQRGAAVLDRLTEAELLAQYEIQGYRVTGLQAVYQVVEHFALHYGQIVFITKQLREVDLGFYSALNATGRSTVDDGTKF